MTTASSRILHPRDPNLSLEDMLEALDKATKHAVKNPALPLMVLTHPEAFVPPDGEPIPRGVERMLQHPRCPATLFDFFARATRETHPTILANPHASRAAKNAIAETFPTLSPTNVPSYANKVIDDQDFAAEDVLPLLRDAHSPAILLRFLDRPDATKDHALRIMRLLQSRRLLDKKRVRAVLLHPKCPTIETLDIWMRHRNARVRAVLAEHPSLPREALRDLSNDRFSGVRRTARLYAQRRSLFPT